MTPTEMFIAALILVLAVGLVTWAWFAIAQVKEKLRSFGEFEGMHLESGPYTAETSEGARWRIPG